MEPLLRRWKWALLPSLEVLQSIIDLLLFNFNQLPNERRHFIQVSALVIGTFDT